MIEAYLILADRIHQELDVLARVVNRAERAIVAARQRPEDQDLYVDSAALNLHDFFGGLERIFQQIGTTVDGDLPAGPDWHRQLMDQMRRDIPDLRPPVLSLKLSMPWMSFAGFVMWYATFMLLSSTQDG